MKQFIAIILAFVAGTSAIEASNSSSVDKGNDRNFLPRIFIPVKKKAPFISSCVPLPAIDPKKMSNHAECNETKLCKTISPVSTSSRTTTAPCSIQTTPIFDVNTRDKHGNTKLHDIVFSCEDPEPILELIEAGADIAAINDQGDTPLLYAAYRGNLEAVKILVHALQSKGLPIHATNNSLQTPLHWAILNGNCNVATYLIDETGADVDAVDKLGNSPLHVAATNGNISMVKYLHKHGADILLKNNNRETARDLAQDEGLHEMVKVIDKIIGSLLASAGELGHVAGILSLIAQGANLRGIYELKLAAGENIEMSFDQMINSFLLFAAEQGYLEAVQALIAQGASVGALTDLEQTVLHVSAQKGHLTIVNYLLAQPGIDAAATDIYGRSARYLAYENGHIAVRDAILAHFAPKGPLPLEEITNTRNRYKAMSLCELTRKSLLEELEWRD